ncbi:MAG: magnesium transporter [bacterium]
MEKIQEIALFIPEIKQHLKDKDYASLKEGLKEIHPVDLAGGWRHFTPLEKLLIFRLLVSRRAVSVFENLSFEEQNHLINNLKSSEVAQVLDDMAADDRADLFDSLSEKSIKKLFSVMKEEEVKDVRELLTYEESTAGGLMTTEFVELKKDMSARQALLTLQEVHIKHTVESISTVYVTDAEHHLIGGVSLQTLIGTPANMLIRDIMAPVQVIRVGVNMDQEEVARIFSKYDLLSTPVVNKDNKLLGIITIDDIVDVIHQEATEDMVKLVGTDEEELISKSVFKIAKIRLPWLFASWFGGLFTIWLIGAFQGTLEKVIVLAGFMPVILGMGGNVGAQSSTIVVRGLAMGHIDVKHLWNTVFKEIRIGLLLGITYGVLLGLVAYFKYGLDMQYRLLGAVVGLGICSSMTIAATIGAFMPLFFKRINIDPAVATGPFVSTTTDILGVLVYFMLGRMLLL